MSRTINVGLIGFGNSGQNFFAPFINDHPYLNLKTISTSNPEKAALAKRTYPDTTIVEDAATIISDPDIALIAVGTPNTSHLELTKQALLAGKHVIVEKPFTITSADADELIELARQQNLVLSVNHTRRFDSGHHTVKKVIDSGLLGTLVEYEVHYDRFRPQLRPNAWKEKDLPGSGILYDLGAHLIDGSLDLFGKPHEVTAHIITQRPGLNVDDNFEVILGYPNLKVTLKAGMLVRELGPTYQLYGDKGSFVKYGTDVQEGALLRGLSPNKVSNWGEEPREIWGKINTEYRGLNLTGHIQSEPGRYQNLIANVYKAITGEQELIIKPEQARTTIRIIELAFEVTGKGEHCLIRIEVL